MLLDEIASSYLIEVGDGLCWSCRRLRRLRRPSLLWGAGRPGRRAWRARGSARDHRRAGHAEREPGGRGGRRHGGKLLWRRGREVDGHPRVWRVAGEAGDHMRVGRRRNARRGGAQAKGCGGHHLTRLHRRHNRVGTGGAVERPSCLIRRHLWLLSLLRLFFDGLDRVVGILRRWWRGAAIGRGLPLMVVPGKILTLQRPLLHNLIIKMW